MSISLPSRLERLRSGGLPGLLILIALALPLLLYAYIGFSTRYMADDYMTAGILHTRGFWGAQKYWYLTWSGRYTFTLLGSFVELIGIRIVPFMPTFFLLVWCGGLSWAIHQLFKLARVPVRALFSIVIATLIVFISLRSQAYLYQVIFWQTGILTYLLPIILWVFWLGVITARLARAGPDRATLSEMISSGVLAFVAGGLSETSVVMQITALALGVLCCLLYHRAINRRVALPLLTISLLTSILSLVLIALSPGNAARNAGYPPPLDPIPLIRGSLKTTATFLQRWVQYRPPLVANAFVLPALLAWIFHPTPATRQNSNLNIIRTLGIALCATLIAFVWIWSGFALAYYMMTAEPPDRALILPQFIVTGWAVFEGYWIGASIKPILRLSRGMDFLRLAAFGLICGLLAVGPLYSATRIATMIPSVRAYASAWDARDQTIRTAREQGQMNVEVPIIKDLSKLGELRPEPDFWINQAAALYYGLDSIVAKESLSTQP